MVSEQRDQIESSPIEPIVSGRVCCFATNMIVIAGSSVRFMYLREPDYDPAPALSSRVAAGLYNIAWGAWTALKPQWLFRFAGLPPLNQPAIFACLAMVIGLYGILYLEVVRLPEQGWLISFRPATLTPLPMMRL